MTELQLYKFIQIHGLEIDWRGDELILWIDFYSIKDFAQMIHGYLDDGGTDVNFQESCIALDIVPLCEHFGIEPEDILPKEGSVMQP